MYFSFFLYPFSALFCHDTFLILLLFRMFLNLILHVRVRYNCSFILLEART
jgi:hypothetical protein